MAKVSVSTTVRQEVGLDLRTKAQLRVKLYEYLELKREMKALKVKQNKLKGEAQNIFADADQLGALLEGTDVDGIKVKLVAGSQKRLDKKKLMKKFGLSQDDLDSCSPEKPNKPYVRISAPGEKDEDEEDE